MKNILLVSNKDLLSRFYDSRSLHMTLIFLVYPLFYFFLNSLLFLSTFLHFLESNTGHCGSDFIMKFSIMVMVLI